MPLLRLSLYVAAAAPRDRPNVLLDAVVSASQVGSEPHQGRLCCNLSLYADCPPSACGSPRKGEPSAASSHAESSGRVPHRGDVL